MKLDRDCITTAGGGDAAHLSQHFPGAEAPQADGELAPEAVHQPEADQRAGDLADDGGRGGPATPRSRTKMKIGSRIRLRMAPEPCTIMKPAGRPMA